ncbi:MAG: murein L,D-transpeptidase [Deltaproteobacteria bacterium]|nr:MAG: murein L,D-transpeptidase [Deltaproteobacteria bacterium]
MVAEYRLHDVAPVPRARVRVRVGAATRCPVVAAMMALAACSEPTAEPTVEPSAAVTGRGGGDDTRAGTPEPRTVRFVRSASVFAAPSNRAARVGTIAAGVRVPPRGRAAGPGCEAGWVAIEPRGWVCGRNVEPSDQPPYTVELPRLPRGQIVPGVYARVVTPGAPTYASPADAAAGRVRRRLDGSVKVRRDRRIETGGLALWKIGAHEYVAEADVRPLAPSSFRGVRLGDDTGWALPVAFVWRGDGRAAPVFDRPAGGRVVGRLAPRAAVRAVDRAGDRVRIGPDRWIARADVRLATATSPPPATEPGERWVDVDLDEQTLVAYEGDTPVFVTLVSSGTRKTPSETGVFRVWLKLAETDMTGQMGDEAPYAVATVPWTQFYAKDLALHTAYWHDGFGSPRSHGCINLSPADARFLYFWTEPEVPPGWSMAHADVDRPGSMVRVRSADDPTPPFKGYAMRVAEARRRRPVP